MVVEINDTLTEYFEKVLNHFHKSQTRLIEAMGHDLAEDTMTFAPDWNPNLYLSGFEKQLWTEEISNEKSMIEILYTGFTEQVDFIDVWWEFATPSSMHKSPEDRELGRDYAYYQETTYDSIADPRKAKHPHFVRKGSEVYAHTMKPKTSEYLNKILRLEELPKTPENNYDF